MNEFSSRDKTFTLVGILLALFLGALDQTIVATALPKIVEDLHGVTRYAWVATSYLLASTVMVPIFGKLADMYSRKMIEVWSMLLFLVGSFLCGVAGQFGDLPLIGDGMNQLIVFRGVQGLGGAGLFAMVFIVIADLFPPSERGKYQGLMGGVFGVSSVLGPLIGGFLTDYGGGIIPGLAGWRWVFYVNLPIGILAFWFIITRMPRLDPPDAGKHKLDLRASALLVVGLTGLILALQLDKRAFPWDSPITIGLMLGGGFLLFLFWRRSMKSPNPVLDFRLFSNTVFSVGNAALFFLGIVFLGVIVFLPLFIVNVLGVSATEAGVSLIPLSLGIVFGATISGQLVSRFGHYRRLLLLGGAILLVGLVLLSSLNTETTYTQVIFYMLICGVGIGPALPLFPLAIQNAVDIRLLGQATSASQFFRQIGGVTGAAFMGTVLAVSLISSFAELSTTLSSITDNEQQFSGDFVDKGMDAILAEIDSVFDTKYSRIEEAVRQGDIQKLDELLPILGQDLLYSQNVVEQEKGLAELKQDVDRRRLKTTTIVQERLRVAFSDAVTRIFFWCLLFCTAGVLLTFFLPEIPLRKEADVSQIERGEEMTDSSK